MAFTKPTDTEVDELASTITVTDGVTAYQICRVVNGWLADEGITWLDKNGAEQTEVKPQRIYNQFAKLIPENMKLGSRFTAEGAEHLAKLVYATIAVQAGARKPSKAKATQPKATEPKAS